MSIRYADPEHRVDLSVGDLVAEGARGGHLHTSTVHLGTSRLRLGQALHTDVAAERAADDPTFQAEVTVRRQVAVDDWSVHIHGRVDGLCVEDDQAVVEEVKSTTLRADVLLRTTLADWPDYTRQLETYLWLVAGGARSHAARTLPVGRLLLFSLLDGARHVLGVSLDHEDVDTRTRQVLQRLVDERKRRLAWLASRRRTPVPQPFAAWRPGQAKIAQRVTTALENGRPLLLEAPTGLGKTAPALWATLRFAFAHNVQVFWATQRTTQQAVVQDVLRRLRKEGLSVRALTLSARSKACAHTAVTCGPERCPFANGYYDKVHDSGALTTARDLDDADPAPLKALAITHQVCPFELARDASEAVDVVIGDVNYALEPGVRVHRHFDGDRAKGWVVVVDEAHALVDRARGWGSPRVTLADAQQAASYLAALGDDDTAPFTTLVEEISEAILLSADLIEGPSRDGVGVAELSPGVWHTLAERVDLLALDYARLTSAMTAPPTASQDPWLVLARAVTALSGALATAAETHGDATVQLVGFGPDRFVGLLCLDPAPTLGPRIAALSGFVGMSATVSPADYYVRVLGLADTAEHHRIDGFFPPEHRATVIAPRVSTLYRDRAAHAPATARLLSDLIAATPGNVALYLSSFAVLNDLSARLTLPPGAELVCQTPDMTDAERQETLHALTRPQTQTVLAAVLGGIFAEGIDLPPGSLTTVCVVGPGLPPVGLERDLLRAYHDEHHDDGFTYASLIPGMTRVIQAAGRLHRRPEDRGAIVLIGRRFRWRDVAALLPDAWNADTPIDPVRAVRNFFSAPPKTGPEAAP